MDTIVSETYFRNFISFKNIYFPDGGYRVHKFSPFLKNGVIGTDDKESFTCEIFLDKYPLTVCYLVVPQLMMRDEAEQYC